MLEQVSFAVVPFTAIAAMLSTLFVVWFVGRRAKDHRALIASENEKTFLFEGTDLIDASPQAREVISNARAGGNDWNRMLSALALHFPGLGDSLDSLDQSGTIGLRSTDGSAQVIATALGNRIRITLSSGPADSEFVQLDPFVFRGMLRETETLRQATEGIPFPVWRVSKDRKIVWANRAYMDAVYVSKERGDWPPPSLFDETTLWEIASSRIARRLQPRFPSESHPEWYECRAFETAGDALFCAIGIDTAVNAERQLREFTQTLAKTFSHLTTGLAIFDRQRRLAMFNPALTDLTGLQADYLASRPTLYNLLDRLRDKQMIPEPKDYGTWRRQISDLEAASSDGVYSETWSLSDNRTYRVTGRPHVGGSVAFLFEDISVEMSLTRRFRSELELGQAVIDALDPAIAVFSASGTLSMVNSAYQALWGTDVADTVDAPSVTEMSRTWMSRQASPLWGEIREFAMHASDRTAWESAIPFEDHSELECRVVPLTGGSTLVSFRQTQSEQDRLRASQEIA